jgi:hypothetical protein
MANGPSATHHPYNTEATTPELLAQYKVVAMEPVKLGYIANAPCEWLFQSAASVGVAMSIFSIWTSCWLIFVDRLRLIHTVCAQVSVIGFEKYRGLRK